MTKKTSLANLKAKPATPEEWISSKTVDVTEGQGSNVTPMVKPAEPMKRFTIDVEESLHKRIKAACAMRGAKMADVIREMLEQEFPKGTA